MKARVKATGEIVELHPYDEVYEKQKEPFKSKMHKICHLEGIEIFDEPDYWTRLEHQAAIAAMQAQMAPDCLDSPEGVACTAYAYAHALVEKMKKKEEK